MLTKKYKLALRIYTIKTDAYKLLNTYIITVVDQINMLQLTNIKTAYQKLQFLKKHIALKNCIQKIKVIKKYRILQKTLKL